jgi:hypothetical protein
MQETLAEAAAARTGTDLGQDMYPQILAGAVIAALEERRSMLLADLGEQGVRKPE